jgi:hypothetical protein
VLVLAPGVLLALLLIMVVLAIFQQIATNGQIQAQLIALLLVLANRVSSISTPKFIQKHCVPYGKAKRKTSTNTYPC